MVARITSATIEPARERPPWWKFLGTRIATVLEARRGRTALKAAVKAAAPAPRTSDGRYNLASATKLGWTLPLLQETFGAFPPQSWDDAGAFKAVQGALSVAVDGQFGQKSYEAMMTRHFAADHIIVAGYPHPAPPGLRLLNWYWRGAPASVRFKSADRRGRVVNVAVGHESVDETAARTCATLLKKKCGVHLMCTEHLVRINDGTVPVVTQHADLAWERLAHAQGENGPSVGIEGVSKYYGKPGDRPLVRGGWVHKGLYAVPPLERLEAFAILLAWVTSGELPGLTIPLVWVGLNRDGRLAMSRVSTASRRPGIAAHCYTDHADAGFWVLYALLRLECGLSPSEAYDAAIGLASTARDTIDVSTYLPADGEWMRRAAA